MNYEHVINIGKHIHQPVFNPTSNISIGAFILLIVVCLIAGGISVFLGGGHVFLISIAFIIWIGVQLHSGLAVYQKADDTYNRKLAHWKTHEVKSYINSLPKEKREIVYMKIEPEISNDVHGQSILGTGFTYTTPQKLTPLVISYKDHNHISSITRWFDTDMTLTKGKTPYIEYQVLPHNLGHGIDKGIYNPKVYLPGDYHFTDIK